VFCSDVSAEEYVRIRVVIGNCISRNNIIEFISRSAKIVLLNDSTIQKLKEINGVEEIYPLRLFSTHSIYTNLTLNNVIIINGSTTVTTKVRSGLIKVICLLLAFLLRRRV